ncbi:hypothetical protein CBM2609_B70010 [Cupriavidus taiwanensis]|nr:hypothetical protein CBM2609_B70010 [Cupriavidus taiwanensis]
MHPACAPVAPPLATIARHIKGWHTPCVIESGPVNGDRPTPT